MHGARGKRIFFRMELYESSGGLQRLTRAGRDQGIRGLSRPIGLRGGQTTNLYEGSKSGRA